MARIHLQFNLPVSVLKEGERFVAYTPALDLSTSGKTYKEAKKRFGEAVYLFFEETVKNGTLDQVLRESGWQKTRSSWKPPVVVSQETEHVKVPA